MPAAKATTKTTAKKTSRITKYRPSNLVTFVIVLLLVALGTVTWLFVVLANSTTV
jgi:hypothetical protein